MSRRVPTGRTYTPDEFRVKETCVRCGKACDVPRGGTCDDCRWQDVPKCNLCGRLGRVGHFTFYTYDIKDHHRNEDFGFKASQEDVREFTYTEPHDILLNAEGLCAGCAGWRTRMKCTCWKCGVKFPNEFEHYKQHGNMCAGCAATFPSGS